MGHAIKMVARHSRETLKIRLPICAAIITIVGASIVFAQQHEVSFISGALRTGDHRVIFPRPGFVKTGTGLTYQIGYATRIFDGKVVAIYSEFPLTLTPTRDIDTSNALSPRSYSTLLFTPGLKLKLVPGLKFSPYVAGGIGIGRLSTSGTTVEGQPNADPSTRFVGAYNFGGGLDAKVFPHLSLRGELRDFYSGTPQLNADLVKNKQHNFMISAGIVVRF